MREMANLQFVIGVACLISLCSVSNSSSSGIESDVEKLHALPTKDGPKEEAVDKEEDNPLNVFLHRTKEMMENGHFVGLEGKNVAGMMDKIEGILKGGVKHAVPVETHKRQDGLVTQFSREGGHHGGHHGGPFGGYVPSKGKPFPSGHGESHKPGAISPAENAQKKKDKGYTKFDFHTKQHALKHKFHDKDLDLYDLKNIWLSMLNDVYQILQDENILKDAGTNIKTLEKIFLLLWDIDLVEPRRKEDLKCPYGFNEAGDLCLSVEFIDEKLKWEDARLYCQVVKGGDLVIFKNACEFRMTIEFLYQIDKKRKHSYWVGASDLDKEGFWKYVDGSNVPRGAGLWGTRLGEIEPSGRDEQDLAILLASDYWYMHDINDWLALKKLNVIPLCQYIPERDGYVVIPTKPTGIGPYAAYDDDIKEKDQDDYKDQKGYQKGYQTGSGYQTGPYNSGPYKRTDTKTKSSRREPREVIDRLEVESSTIKEKKIAEKKIAEEKIAEKKIAEEKIAEKKIAEEKIAEKKIAEEKIA